MPVPRTIIAFRLKRASARLFLPPLHRPTRVKGNGADMVRAMIDSGIVATPGIAFGLRGDNYVRFAVTQPVEKVEEAVKRMSASPAVMKFAGS